MGFKAIILSALASTVAAQIKQGPNNNYYEIIGTSNSFADAKSKAAAKSHLGSKGHLLTITSEEEQKFIEDNFFPKAGTETARTCWQTPQNADCRALWLGASDAAENHRWHWVDGPEDGSFFWIGNMNGKTVNGGYANWADDQPQNTEDCALIDGKSGQNFYDGKWHDYSCTLGNGRKAQIVVEYEHISTTTTKTQTTMTVASHNERVNEVINSILERVSDLEDSMGKMQAQMDTELTAIRESVVVNKISADDTETRLTAMMNAMNTTLNSVKATSISLSDALKAAANASPSVNGPTSCVGEACTPSIVGDGSNVALNARNGKIQAYSDTCSVDDLCDVLSKISNAVKQLNP